MRSFKKIICLGMVVAIIVGINTILNLAFQPYNNFRNDMHNLDTHKFDTVFVGTSHGKAGINPDIIDGITGYKSINMCLGGQSIDDSYYIVKEACRVNKPKRMIYELDPSYWVTEISLSPEYMELYNELPMSYVKVECYFDKIWNQDFRATLFPWYVNRKGLDGAVDRLKNRLFNKRYKSYATDFYDCDVQSYEKNGQTRIHRIAPFIEDSQPTIWNEGSINKKVLNSFYRLVKLCKNEKIDLKVIITPIPRETLDRYKESYLDSDKYFSKLMLKYNVDYFNYNYTDITGFDHNLTGFQDYEGHMYEDQADFFSRKLANDISR